MKKKLLHSLGAILVLSLFAVALWVLHHELRAYHWEDILDALERLPTAHLLAALSLTLLSYLMMTGYDALSLYYIRRPLGYAKIALASFIGYAFSNNIGLSMLAGGSVRYRLYSSWGLSLLETTGVLAFCSLTLWLGFLALGGVVFFLNPMVIPQALHLPFDSVRPLGEIFLLAVGAYLVLSIFRRKPIKIRTWEFPVPSPKLSIAQIAVAFLDWCLAGTVLFALLPHPPGFSWVGFMAIYLFAQLAGLISQLPGGLGVFETAMILLMPSDLPASQVLGSLLAYRGIYYLFPFFVALVLLGTREILQKKRAFQKIVQSFGYWSSFVVPPILALASFMGGAILLFSGATPEVTWRLNWLNTFLPLSLIEISHFLGSLAGIGLIILARGLYRKMDAAYVLAVLMLGAGIALSLLKGLDFEEAIALSIVLGALLPCRAYFYRKSSLIAERFTPVWAAAVILVLVCSLWLGLFSYKHVSYSGGLWWQFALHGDAPRFLRATLGSIVLLAGLALAKLLRPASPKPRATSKADVDRAIPIVEGSQKTYAYLALLGDKTLLFNQAENAFIMYGVEGRSWVAMADPIGPLKEWRELLWLFRETSDRFGGWPVFYEVGSEHLSLYLELGLAFLKLGEEARVALEGFALEGAAHKKFRHVFNKLHKEGCEFQVLSPDDVISSLPEFRVVSDSWLAMKKTREKGFSLGFFSEEYLKRFSAGVVRREGKIIAFANIWKGAAKQELSIDLMRHHPDAPSGVMDYLFIQLMLWGKQEGYCSFNLGMAPLSGLQDRELSPLWNRLGSFIFRHGEHFYNLQGLRQYKEKFQPQWEPKYLVSPGGLPVPRILTNVASLVSKGMKGVIAK
jgi:phosphatidylglycerol lysyltransferase